MASLIRTNLGFFLVVLFMLIMALWVYGFDFNSNIRSVFAFPAYDGGNTTSCAAFKDGDNEEYTYTLKENCSISSTDGTICWGGLTVDNGASLQIADTTFKFIDTGEIKVVNGAITLQETGSKIAKTSALDPCVLCVESDWRGVCVESSTCTGPYVHGCSGVYECGSGNCCCITTIE